MERTIKALMLALLLLVGIAPSLHAGAPVLSWQSPTVPGERPDGDLNGITYGNGVYVAVGESGSVLTSRDGTHWESRTTPTSMPLNGVAYGEGRFIAVGGRYDPYGQGSGSVVLSSEDGQNWSLVFVRENSGLLRAVTYAGGRFVAVGWSYVTSSEDGLSWSEPVNTSANDLKAVTYGHGKYVAIGDDALIVSADGLTWTRAAGVYQGRGVVFGGGRFYAVHDTPDLKRELLSSADGLTWTRSLPPVAGVEQLTYGAGQLVGVGFDHGAGVGVIATSADGENWRRVTANTGSWLKGVVYGEGRFIAVGSRGIILTLDERADWQERPLQENRGLYGIAYGNGNFVAVGPGGTVVTSGDGLSWTQRNSRTDASLERVRYGNGRFVAIGRDGTIITSADGAEWEAAPRWEGNLGGLAFGNGIFVAVGHPGAIITSADGVSWTARETGSTDAVLDVTFGQGRFYAFVYGGRLLTSDDGVTWHQGTTSAVENIWRLVYIGGRLVANSPISGILASDDMTDLTLKPAWWLWSITDAARGDGWQVTVGRGAYTSTDGIGWGKSGAETNCLQSVAFGGGRFVGVGASGCIRMALTGGSIAPAALPLPDRVRLGKPTIAPPPGFRDLDPQHWAFPAVGAAVNAKLVNGYPEGVFMPDNPIRRAEFLAVIMRAYPQPDALGQPFDDVPAEHWAATLIRQARGAGLVKGDGNNFRPDEHISRAEMAVILQRALSLPLPTTPRSFPDVGETWSWASDSVQALNAHGLIRGLPDGGFGPGQRATRAEVATILTRLFGQ